MDRPPSQLAPPRTPGRARRLRARAGCRLALSCALGIFGVFLLDPGSAANAQESSEGTVDGLRSELDSLRTSLGHRLDTLSRQVDDLMFFQRLGDVAEIDILWITGPPLRYQPNPTAQGAGNPFRFWTYVFIPRQIDQTARHPLIVLPHGGVHGHFDTRYVHILRELLEQGYTVTAPEYRGSIGYGRSTYNAIDYGGTEIEDTYAARNEVLASYPFLDPKRVGIIGWSHGGLHTLMNVFEHGDSYAVAYAGVPVSDLIARMGYKSQRYRDFYEAEHHIGKSAAEDVEEYRRRSPSWNTHKYDGTPLLIHTTTNDEDVNVFEVERLIQALQANGTPGFEYEIYEDAPGGHVFDRLDTPAARKIRQKTWRFLARRLQPANPPD